VSPAEIRQRIERFKADLPKLSADSMVDRHVLFGDAFVLNKDLYFTLKEEVADHFKIHPPEVVMVGSGKLGFSIVGAKRYREFGDHSDIDLAIVSSLLFDRIWEQVFDSRGKLGYWPDESQFSLYLARGWIRPDKLPPARSFPLADDWWRFFQSLAASGRYGRYKVSGGLYRNWTFLKGYQTLAVHGCKAQLELPR
jgi:hypothetical protein